MPRHFWYFRGLTKTYARQKLSEDLEVGVRGLYRDNGYFKVSVGEPVLENIDTASNRLGVPLIAGRSRGKAVNITIHVEEGERYHMGTLKIVSADPDKALSLKVEALKGAFPLKQGDIFSTEKVRKALETYGKIYGEYGFIDFTPEPDTEIDEEKQIINLTLKEKGKQSIGLQGGVSGLAGSFIGLTYQTNNFLGLGETLTFSAQFGDLSRSFLFGFTEPYLFDRPISSGFTIFSSRYKFDQARQAALLTGQAVSINPQFIQNYNQDSTGFTLFASYPIRKLSFTRVGLQYGLTRTNITAFNDASKLLFTQVQFRSIAGPSALNGIVSSTITPTITYNTVNNPINPTGGKSYFYSMGFSGLGGNVKSISNVFDWKYYHPVNKRRNVLGLHASGAFITGFGGGEPPPYSRFYMGGESDIRGFDVRSITPVTYIPVKTAQQFTYTCFTCLNGFGQPTQRTISLPVLGYTISFPGGDSQGYGNVEYRIPIIGNTFQTGLLFDGGTNGILRKGALRLDPTGFSNLSTSFPDAVSSGALAANRQLGIAPGTNFRLRGSTGIEFVVQLPIIQAPFRIYYAYNIHRLHSQLLAPQDFIEASEICDRSWGDGGCTLGPPPATLPPDVWRFQVRPTIEQLLKNPGSLNYFEPARTFRFTVSRTF